MVQIIPQQDIGEQIGVGLGSGFSSGMSKGLDTLQKQLVAHKENQAQAGYLKDFPYNGTEAEQFLFLSKAPGDSSKLTNNFVSFLKMQSDKTKAEKQGWNPEKQDKMATLLTKMGFDKDSSENYSELFGTFTEGGKTEQAKVLLDKIVRGSMGQPLQAGQSTPEIQSMQSGQVMPETSPEDQVMPEGQQEAPQGEEFEYPKLEYFKYLRPEEKIKRQAQYRKENGPIYNDNKNQIKANKHAERAFDTMQKTSKYLPKGFVERLNVNPITGDLIVPSWANKQTELYVKTLNEFAKDAKGSFGAKITNFELKRFMMTYPNLLNSEEGRELILRQLKIVNDINSLYAEALDETFKHYKLDNISQEDADDITEQKISKQVAALEKEYRDFDKEADLINDYNDPDKVKVISPDGVVGSIPKDFLEKALKQGYTKK